jgi:hypothetical protein
MSAGKGLSLYKLYPLADAIDMELELGKDGIEIRGRKNFNLDILPGLRLTLPLKIVSSLCDLSGTEIGVLVHVKGDLYFFAGNDSNYAAITISLIDGSQVSGGLNEIFERNKVLTFNEADKLLNPCVQAAFERRATGTTWKQIL